jgi:hypothetical protein
MVREMLIVVSLILLTIGGGLLALAALAAFLRIWLSALLGLVEGKFIRAGLWLCLGIMIANLFFGKGESFMPLYVAIMGLAAIAAVWRLTRKLQPDGGMATITINMDERLPDQREPVQLLEHNGGR